MSDNLYHDIVNRCLTLDSKAVSIFAALADQTEDQKLRVFWGKMSDEEREHVAFWERVLDLIHNHMLPKVFDEPGKIIASLSWAA